MFWDKENLCWGLKDNNDNPICSLSENDPDLDMTMIIGNIYDNPELLLDYNKQVTTV